MSSMGCWYLCRISLCKTSPILIVFSVLLPCPSCTPFLFPFFIASYTPIFENATLLFLPTFLPIILTILVSTLAIDSIRP